MSDNICPECKVNQRAPNRSYCKDCENAMQNEYKKKHPQVRTEDQKERQRFMDRQRVANMTPEKRQAFYDRRQKNDDARLERDPSIAEKRKMQAAIRRTKWDSERRVRQQRTQKLHYDQLQLRPSQGLCAYSKKCNEPPVGSHKYCVLHWCVTTWFAHVGRVKPEYTAQDLVSLWHKQEGKCAVFGMPLIPGETAAIDHITPIDRGGDGSLQNIRFVHSLFNCMKNNWTDEEIKKFHVEHNSKFMDWVRC